MARPVGQPSAVGEIIAGVALGPSLLGLISVAPDTMVSVAPMGLRLLWDVSILDCYRNVRHRPLARVYRAHSTPRTAVAPAEAVSS